MAHSNDAAASPESDSSAAGTPQWSSPSTAPAARTDEKKERPVASVVVFSDLDGTAAKAKADAETDEKEADADSGRAGEVARDAAASLRFSS